MYITQSRNRTMLVATCPDFRIVSSEECNRPLALSTPLETYRATRRRCKARRLAIRGFLAANTREFEAE